MTRIGKFSFGIAACLGAAYLLSVASPDQQLVETVREGVETQLQSNEWFKATAIHLSGWRPSGTQSIGSVFMYAGR